MSAFRSASQLRPGRGRAPKQMLAIGRALMAAGSTAVITAALGLSPATAGPASAADGSWRAYGNTNLITSSSSTWKCGSTEQIASNVGVQVCAIRSASGTSVQGR